MTCLADPAAHADRDLVLRVMDDDLGQRNEVIGILRLPLSGLDLHGASQSQHGGLQQHSCLILHSRDQQRLRSGTVTVSPIDAARLNLKISRLSEEVDDLKCSLKKEKEKFQKTYAEYAKLRKQVIEEQMEHKTRSSEDDESDPDPPPPECGKMTRSEGNSPKTRRPATVGDSRSMADLDLLHHFQSAIAEKDAKIESLEKTLKEMEVRDPTWHRLKGKSEVPSLISF